MLQDLAFTLQSLLDRGRASSVSLGVEVEAFALSTRRLLQQKQLELQHTLPGGISDIGSGVTSKLELILDYGGQLDPGREKNEAQCNQHDTYRVAV